MGDLRNKLSRLATLPVPNAALVPASEISIGDVREIMRLLASGDGWARSALAHGEELTSLRAEVARLTAEVEARPKISREDARIWSSHPDDLDFSNDAPIEAVCRISDALRAHGETKR